MATLRNMGDEVQAERLVCFCRKKDREVVVPLTSGHRGIRIKLHGLPARAIVEKVCEFVK